MILCGFGIADLDLEFVPPEVAVTIDEDSDVEILESEAKQVSCGVLPVLHMSRNVILFAIHELFGLALSLRYLGDDVCVSFRPFRCSFGPTNNRFCSHDNSNRSHITGGVDPAPI